MRIVKLSAIKDELQSHLKRQDLFPIIGSGFTKGCRTEYEKDGRVPSGEEMKLYMQEYLTEHGHEAPVNESFSKVARYYDKFVVPSDFCAYFKRNFLGVKLTGWRKRFLDINWKFIYTLNLDDAIEKNSRYQFKVLPNKEIESEGIKDEKCVFKLHGDAEELVKYKRKQGSGSSVLSFLEYISSLKTNESMLVKLREDLSYSNALFIGCSLSDELDLLSVAQQLKEAPQKVKRNRYFVMMGEPSEYLSVDLEDHGIDTVISVDDWETFYQEFSDIAKTCNYVMEDELKKFRNLPVSTAPKEEDIDYLLHGKFLLDKTENTVRIPFFFIHRDIEERILQEMEACQIQIIHGTRVSGKTYLLAGLLRQIRDRDTYYFDSRNQVDKQLLTHLLRLKRSTLFFDTNVLTLDAVKNLLNTDYAQLGKQNINIVLCINNSDREILELVAYNRKYQPGFNEVTRIYELSNSFSKDQGKGGSKQAGEVEAINEKLQEAWHLPFSRNSTLLDNLLDLQIKLRENGNTIFDPPIQMESVNTSRICLLILLAQNEKVSAREIVQCGLMVECGSLLHDLKMTVEEDHRSLLSLNAIDSARYQIVCNAKVWLLGQLREIVKRDEFKKMAIDAFNRLVTSFLGRSRQFRQVEKLVKFDKLNEIFPNSKRMIVEIYEELQPVLGKSYQYYHQNAKCHLWGMSKSDYGLEELEYARIAALTGLSIVGEELDAGAFLPRQVAYAHMLNTLTIIYTKLCFFEKFSVIETVDETVDYFYRAVNCSENYAAMRNAKFKHWSVREESGGVLSSWISYITTNEVEMSAQSKEKVTRILAFWMDLAAVT